MSMSEINRRDFVQLASTGTAACILGAPIAALGRTQKNGGSRTAMRTGEPFTYCIDYGSRDGHLENPGRILENLKAAPPKLMHIGHDVPIPNSFGPFVSTEDGRVRLLDPSEAKERSKKVMALISDIKDAGCEIVIPYICNQTIAGDPRKRMGIWEFYDRWDDYAELDIGPRPEKDPQFWLAREHYGRPHFNYEMRHSVFLPMGMQRWAPCCNNPYYNQWQEVVVRQIARADLNGVFVDNCNLNCYCEFCEARFQTYLSERFSAKELKNYFDAESADALSLGRTGSRLNWVKHDPLFKDFLRENFDDEELVRWFGTADLNEAKLEESGNGWLWGRAHDYRLWLERRFSPEELLARYGVPELSGWGLKTAAERLHWVETKRFWADSVKANLLFIRETGLAERDDFIVCPNWGNMEEPDAAEFREEIGHQAAIWAPGTDIMMFEEGNQPGAIAPGLYLDHILQYKLSMALGIVPGVLPSGTMHQGTVALANAQNVTFGGGAYIQPGTDFIDERANWSGFFERHGELLQGAEPMADIGLIYLFDELVLENQQHQEWVYRFIRYLCAQQILFDLVSEKQIASNHLQRYAALLVPSVRYLSDAQIDRLRTYQEKGGILICVGECGTHDALARRRPESAWADLRAQTRPDGSGLCMNGNGRFWMADSPEPLIGRHRVSREEGLQFATYSASSMNVPYGHAGLVHELDRMIGMDRYLEAYELPPRLEKALGRKIRLADARAAMGVRFAAYRPQPDHGAKLLLHAVNYNVPLLPHPRGKTVEPVMNLEVCLTGPIEGVGDSAMVYEPGQGAQEVSVAVTHGTLRFTIPKLDVYKLLVF